MQRSKVAIRLDRPLEYKRILEGDTFRKARVKLYVRGAELHIEVDAEDGKSLSSAVNGIRKQIEIIRKTAELVK